MKIPFSPPFIDEDVINEVVASLRSGWITTGPKVKELESIIAKSSNVPNALGVNSATSGLMLALHWFGITRGDEVLIPSYTYSATALAVMHIGATPVMIDSGEDFNMNPELILSKITSRTKAIIPVDFGGWPCDYNRIREIIESEDVKQKFQPKGEQQNILGRILILADAAHSIGAIYKGVPAASHSDVAVFSLHAVKNVTSAEGGMILMNMPKPFDNNEVYATMRLWSLNGQTKDAFTKTQGSSWRYDIVYPGFKMNMPDVLAALALGQIKKYANKLIPERRRVFEIYYEGFKDWVHAQNPSFDDGESVSSFHLYALRINEVTEIQRDKIIDLVMERGVSVNVHFQPLPMLSVFKNRGYDIEDYPVAKDSYTREISLPIYPQLTDGQALKVVEEIKKATEIVLS